MIRILFVCLGNICRSPMAEGLFLHHLEEAGLSEQFQVDSAGTGGWHTGERADARMLETAAKHQVHLPSHARQVRPSDFEAFDYIIPMDHSNYSDLAYLQKEHGGKAQLILMRDFDPLGKGEAVPDPYYGGSQGFDRVYEMLNRSTKRFLDWVQAERGV